MDKIDFTIEPPYTHTDGCNLYTIGTFLNRKKLHGLLNVSEVLPLPNYKKSEFILFTCSCGSPGCSGYSNEIIHTIKDDIVEWQFPDSNEYKTPKLVYTFDRKEFTEGFEKLLSKMLELEFAGVYHETLYDTYDEEHRDLVGSFSHYTKYWEPV